MLFVFILNIVYFDQIKNSPVLESFILFLKHIVTCIFLDCDGSEESE